jgi:hypothetical protein
MSMADKNTPAGGADFVAKIVKDPKNPPATLMLRGFLGASSEDKHTRLYFDPHLSSYAEIPNDAILHTQSAASEDGLGAAHVWIQRDAQLTYGPAASQRPKGAFLEGPIMQDHLAAAAGAGAGLPVTQPLGCGGVTAPVICRMPTPVRPCVPPPTHLILQCPTNTLLDAGCQMATPGAGTPVAAFTFVLAACRTSFVDPGCGGGGTATMERALPTLYAYCTQVCHPGGGGGTATLERALPTLWAYCTQACHPGGGGGTPVMALPTLWAYCTQACHPGGGGGTPVMAAPTQWAFCSQVCGPSFLGMGCGTGGTIQIGISQQCSMVHQCVPPSIADNSCPR